MKKFLIVFAVLIVIVGVGGYIGYQYAVDKVSEQVVAELESTEILDDPELMAELEQEFIALEELSEELGSADQAGSAESESQTESRAASAPSSSPTPADTSSKETSEEKPKFDSKQEAVGYVLRRFDLADINRIRKMASDGLTEDEKQELRKIALTKFTQDEIDAVRQAVFAR